MVYIGPRAPTSITTRAATNKITASLNSAACTALGISAGGVIGLCRGLLAAGHDPSTPLDAYRGEMLCLRVRSIGEAARLRLGSHGVGFERDPECGAAPPMQANVPAPAQPHTTGQVRISDAPAELSYGGVMIRCVKFRRYEKNTLRGFCDLQLVCTGIILKDCSLHEKAGKFWISFPARPYRDKDGGLAWAATVEFADDAKQAREAFQKQAVAAVRAVADTGAAA